MRRRHPLERSGQFDGSMSSDHQRFAEHEALSSKECGGHAGSGLPRRDRTDRPFQQIVEIGKRECSDDSGPGISRVNRGANDERQMVFERPNRTGNLCQWALWGSDQDDSRVTRSNSRRSLATTWSASALVDSASTCEITRTRAVSTLSMACEE